MRFGSIKNKIYIVMRTFRLTILSIVAFLFIVSCKKDDTEAPVITITSPLEGSTHTAGQDIPVIGVVTDETELSEVRIQNTAQTLSDKSKFVIDLKITNPDTITPGNYFFTVSAKDAAGNASEKTVNFTIVK